jgi:hypothetical protein
MTNAVDGDKVWLERSYCEFIQKPTKQRNKMEWAVLGAPVAHGTRLVDETFAKDSTTVPLKRVSPGTFKEFEDVYIEAEDALPIPNYDFTSGTTEAQFEEWTKAHPYAKLDQHLQMRMGMTANVVEQKLKDMDPDFSGFTPRVKGFLKAAALSAMEPQAHDRRSQASAAVGFGAALDPSAAQAVQTPHNYFQQEFGATWVHRYLNNFTDEDRSDLRAVLLPYADDVPSLMSQALLQTTSRGSVGQRLADLKYRGCADVDGGQEHHWPTYDAQFRSIVEGTPELRTHDELSRLAGSKKGSGLAKLETGHIDPSGNIDKNVVPYTINSFDFNPFFTTLPEHALFAYDNSADTNPLLEKVSPAERARTRKAVEDGRPLSEAAPDFNTLFGLVKQAVAEHGNQAFEDLAQGGEGRVRFEPEKLRQFGKWLETAGPAWKPMRKAYDHAMTNYLDDDSVKKDGGEALKRLKALGMAMTDCDGYGSGSRARHRARYEALSAMRA